jgi:acyl-CoA thioesterase-1
MRSVLSLFIVVTLSFARTGWADSNRVILIIGDSLSAAYGMELGESWPSLLQRRLTQDGHAYRVFNSSIVGDTTEGGLSRLPRLLAGQRPDIVIIELGGNDGLRGLPLEVTRKNLQSMIDQSQATGASIVLVGIQLPPNYGQTYTSRFSAMFLSLAADSKVSFIPFLLEGIALDPSLMQLDGIHPTAQAQPLLLQNIWPALEPLLQQQ